MCRMYLSPFVSMYYFWKPIIPRRLQIFLRRKRVSWQLRSCGNTWPIDIRAADKPANWSGWPNGKKFTLVLTHDVEGTRGLERIPSVMEIEKGNGLRSSFNLVPQAYRVKHTIRDRITSEGFEVGVHGLFHDGKLYKSNRIFDRRVKLINMYLKQWDSIGFRSPAMHHHLSWIHKLDIDYDSSTFDTDPFEPQPDAICTIFPVWLIDQERNHRQGYVELPRTLPEDLTLFVLMKQNSIDIWKQKLNWIAEKGGLALINTHPDYMYFGSGRRRIDEYPAEHYRSFMSYVVTTYKDSCWYALPKEVAHFWSTNAARG